MSQTGGFSDFAPPLTPSNLSLLWDTLKVSLIRYLINAQSKLKKSEEEEIARIIGLDLIQKCEDLKREFTTFHEILSDLENDSEKKRQAPSNINLFSKTSN